jgi:DNA mismatch repair protein MutL
MGRIKQLCVHLINQIAAGEVIERPASVVKELTENSIDAGASCISVEITNDCRDIRVADNGGGIHPDDIALAFSKHATSKIATDEDLFAINTLGFRGEALSSIISIAKVTCTTRSAEFETGTRVKCANSEVQTSETGCAIGTIMEVKDLFYNLPARLKFLRNPNTEFSYIQELIQSLALSHPEVSFELKKNGKTTFKTIAGSGLLQVIKEIAPDAGLKEVQRTDKLSGLKISGYVSTPDFTRSSKKSYHTYINSRAVKCPVFQKSIDTAYKTLIAAGKYPFVVLNLEIPPADVDVNVHPTKKEVRYKNTNQIFNFIQFAIRGSLENDVEPEPLPQNVVEFKHPEIFHDKESDTIYVSDKVQTLFKMPQPDVSRSTFGETEEHSICSEKHQAAVPADSIIGQYKNTYILIEQPEGLEIIDQHIAHERYIYEKLKNEKEPVSQMLFVSDVIQVSTSEAELIKENLEKFEKFGYGIEFLAENEIIFKKVPQMLAKVNPKEILADILESDGTLEEKILITSACKASVKAGDKLSTWQMQEIIKNWRTTKMPYTCPHGRPISKTIPHNEIAAFFMRKTT